MTSAERDTPAIDLYQGEHWSVARRIHAASLADVWVASAGFGLVHISTKLRPYAATFSSGHPDSVALPECADVSVETQLSEWWSALQSEPRLPTVGLDQVAQRGPVVLAASRPYVSAMRHEIAAAASVGQIVIASASPAPAAVAHLCPPANGRLRQILGGSMQSLNVRLAEAIVLNVDAAELTVGTASTFVGSLSVRAPESVRYDRRPLSDEEVVLFIRQQLALGSASSWSPLLRALRDNGMACEQRRFRRLFLASMEGL